MWITALVSGIALGSFYSLIAMGFALIFGVTHAFNLAHGELVVLAGYVAYWLWKGWDSPSSSPSRSRWRPSSVSASSSSASSPFSENRWS